MAGPGGAAQRQEKKSRGLGWLLAGIVIGALGAVFLPDLASPYLPDSLRAERVQVAGVVEAKSTEGERLLLTVGSEAGATLVTFRDDIARIDLLVTVGDSVRLEVDEYTPFIDDAEIRRVMKPRDWREAPPGMTADTAEADTASLADTLAESGTAAEPDTAATDGAAIDTGTVDPTSGALDTEPAADVP